MKGGSDHRSVPGNTIAVQADMPFSGLTKFGTAFLSKFECSQMPHPVSFLLPMHIVFSKACIATKTSMNLFYVW
jgi:hypothetical protein